MTPEVIAAWGMFASGLILAAAGAAELAGLVERIRDDPAATDAERLAAGQVLAYLAVSFDIN